jgi:hypothetical protein
VQHLVERLEHHTHAAPADDLQDFVMPQPAEGVCPSGGGQEVQRQLVPTGRFGSRRAGIPFVPRARLLSQGRLFQETPRLLVGLEQRLDPPAQARVAGTGFFEIGRPLGRVALLQRDGEDALFVHLSVPCGKARFPPSFHAQSRS